MNRPSRTQIVELDKRHVWHPYTAMGEYIEQTEPLVIDRAQGSRLYDLDGRSYIDGNSSWWTAVLGHGHPRLVDALRRQSERLCHTSLAGVTHEAAACLAAELVAVAPAGLERVFFSDDGSTAIEVAVKIALQYFQQRGLPGKTRFVALSDAFHGETLGATSLGGVELFRRPFADVMMDCIHVPPDDDGYERAFAVLARLLESRATQIAALVIEPMVQGAGGMRIYDARYLSAVREITARYDVLLIVDEVFTGYGRTGPMWASNHANVSADIMCVAKGFSGGVLPMAATLASGTVFEAFLGARDRALYYGHTFCGNPLGAALAREVLAIYRDEQILERAKPKAARIADVFAALAGHPGVVAPRTLGMLGALELKSGEGYLARSGWRVYEEALKLGAYLRPLGNVVYVAPPLNIPDDDLESLLEVLDTVVRKIGTEVVTS